MGASGATPEEHAAATRLQATFKGRKQRVAFEEKKAHASEFAAYDQATLERSRRMQEREERKAMLKDLPASEVEEWHARQEHDAAVVVQSTFRMHKAKQDVARKRLESRSEPRVLAADPDAADVLAASYEPELDDGAFQERTITARPYRQPPPVAQVVAGLKMRHGQNELGLGALTMDEYLRGRRNADEVMREYREFSARAAKAEALRTEKRRLAQASYQKNRAAAHGSLAELPADATAANFPILPAPTPRASGGRTRSCWTPRAPSRSGGSRSSSSTRNRRCWTRQRRRSGGTNHRESLPSDVRRRLRRDVSRVVFSRDA